jgi:hypothetical protein
MKTKAKQGAPKTVGELRQRLTQLGNPWTVDPRLSDDEPLPDPPRGGQREEEIPAEHRFVPIEPAADIGRLIAAQPPANPFLRERWVEVGLLDKDQAQGAASEPGEGVGGAA